jgi:hypothetical protein
VAQEMGFAVHFLIIDDVDRRDLRKLLEDVGILNEA